MSQVSSVQVVPPSPSATCGSISSTDRQPGFHLLVESLEHDSAASTVKTAADLPILEVPSGVLHLVPTKSPLRLVSRKPRLAACVFEAVEVGGRARLLLVTPPGLRVRLNGQAVPLVVLLKVGDQLQLDARAILHVTEYRGAGAIRPGIELIGSPCGVCRLPLVAETQVYICGGCGLPLHLESAPKPEAERLECALFGDCPSCGAEVKTSSGHVWLPEL
jgi:hypothetical protein